MALVFGDVVNFPRDEDSFALALILGLHYHSQSCFSRSDIVIEVEYLVRGDPSAREELVLFWKSFLHEFQILSKVVLQSNQVHAGEVVDHLVGFHSLQFFRREHLVCPKYVPVVLWVLAFAQFPSECMLCNSLYDRIPDFLDIEDDLGFLWLFSVVLL